MNYAILFLDTINGKPPLVFHYETESKRDEEFEDKKKPINGLFRPLDGEEYNIVQKINVKESLKFGDD